jgi:ornithine cyclodeaminase
MKVLSRAQIEARLDPLAAMAAVCAGFIAYSRRQVQLMPTQNFQFPAIGGECCVKSAHVHDSPYFVVKVSTGFYTNPARGLPSNNGLSLVMSALTGEPVALLQDEGWLTSIRTAIAGRLGAALLAPARVNAIGIIGAGTQARLQLEHLQGVTDCRQVHVWAREQAEIDDFIAAMAPRGFAITGHRDPEPVVRLSNLVVTATPSRRPIVMAPWVQAGTHITAVGADAVGKQELDPQLLAAASLVVVDSRAQCAAYGEVAHAVRTGLLQKRQLRELGALLARRRRTPRSDDAITVLDLTGLAVQDAQIASCILGR